MNLTDEQDGRKGILNNLAYNYGILSLPAKYALKSGKEAVIIKKGKKINETECNGFKVTAYIEDLPEKERKELDNNLTATALKILHDFYTNKESK